MTKRTKHHHGNLRAALIEAGIALLDDEGPDALSIRKAAAIAGVSHAAPAHHFPNLAAFREAVAAEGFRRFTGVMEAEIQKAGDGPRDKILASGKGYLRFAMANPGLFQVMFGATGCEQGSPELSEAGTVSYAVLQRVCAPLAPGKAGAEGNELLVWSMVHGFATLVLSGNPPFNTLEDPLALFEAISPLLPLKEEALGEAED